MTRGSRIFAYQRESQDWNPGPVRLVPGLFTTVPYGPPHGDVSHGRWGAGIVLFQREFSTRGLLVRCTLSLYTSVPPHRPCLILSDFSKCFNSFLLVQELWEIKVCPNMIRNRDNHLIGILLAPVGCVC